MGPHPAKAGEMEAILARLLLPDSAAIAAATADLRAAFRQVHKYDLQHAQI